MVKIKIYNSTTQITVNVESNLSSTGTANATILPVLFSWVLYKLIGKAYSWAKAETSLVFIVHRFKRPCYF